MEYWINFLITFIKTLKIEFKNRDILRMRKQCKIGENIIILMHILFVY